MKRIIIIIIAIITATISIAFAKDKDKPETKPELTDAQKIELLIIERKVMQAHIQALPYMQAEQSASAELQAKQKQIEDMFHSTNWRLDLLTLEFVNVPKTSPEKENATPSQPQPPQPPQPQPQSHP